MTKLEETRKLAKEIIDNNDEFIVISRKAMISTFIYNEVTDQFESILAPRGLNPDVKLVL